MEARTYIETFIDYMDAFHYLERMLYEHSDWQIKDSSGIQYLNYAWRVGVSFERSQGNPIGIATEVPLA